MHKMKPLNELCKEAHEAAIKSDFYKNDDKIETMKIFAIDGHKTADEVKGYIKSMRICQLLLLTISELTEAMEADRNDNYSLIETELWGHDLINDEAIRESGVANDFKQLYEVNIKDTFENEIAGACIRIFDLCGFLGIDLESHIKAAMHYNTLREPKYGKKY